MVQDKEVRDKQNQNLQEKLKKSESDNEAISKDSEIKDKTIERQKRIIIGLVIIILAIFIIALFSFLPVAQWIKKTVNWIGSLSGLWSFVSMILALKK